MFILAFAGEITVIVTKLCIIYWCLGSVCLSMTTV